MNEKVTYRQQVSYCGKASCKRCCTGTGHGPYWYAYRVVDGRTVRTYVGKSLPPDAQAEVSPPATGTVLASAPLRLYVLGQLRLERRVGEQWRVVQDAAWQQQQILSLLAYLASQGRHQPGGPDEVVAQLWPELETEAAVTQLQRALRNLRQMLGYPKEHTARRAASGPQEKRAYPYEEYLRLDSTRVWVDADAFEDLLTQAQATRNDPEEAERLLLEALARYSGDFLPEERTAAWAQTRREELRHKWTALLLELADLYLEEAGLADALGMLDRLLAVDPLNELAVQRLMLALARLQRRGEAMRVYQRLLSALQSHSQREPLADTKALFTAIQHEKRLPRPTPISPSKASPLQVIAIGRPNQKQFVGRDAEQETLRQLLLVAGGVTLSRGTGLKKGTTVARVALEAPRTHCMLLMGEAGIGKTRLAEETAREAQRSGWDVVWSTVYAQESGVPYRLWTEALRGMLEQGLWKGQNISLASQTYQPLRMLLPEVADTLPTSGYYAPLSPEEEMLRLREAVYTLLTSMSNSAPLLIVLDDIQWADGSSCELFAYLVRRLPGHRIVLLGTCREAELAANLTLHNLLSHMLREHAVETLHIEPLSDSHIAELVADVPEPLVQHIQAQAAGNPLFAEELAHSIQAKNGKASGMYPYGPGQQESELVLPQTITAALDSRLHRLSNTCRQFLSKAAVLGSTFNFHLISALETSTAGSDEDIVLDLLDEALQSGVLAESGTGSRITYSFWHPLLASHLYNSLSLTRRIRLHQSTAEVLQQVEQANEDEMAATIVQHLVKGGGDAARIAHYAERAANYAYALSAYAEAGRYYQLAVEPLRVQHDSRDEQLHQAFLLERLAESVRIQGRFEEARQLFGRVLEVRSRTSPAPEEAQQEAQIQALLLTEIAWTWRYTGDNQHAHERCVEGEEVLRSAGISAGPAWARLRFLQGSLYWQSGDYEEARQAAEEALLLFEHSLDLPRSSSSEDPASLTRTRRTMLGDPVDAGRPHVLLGSISNAIGRRTEALEHLLTALDIFKQYEREREIAHVSCNIGHIYLKRAEYALAQTYLRRSLDLAERIGDLPLKSVVLHNLAELAASSGDLTEAEVLCRHSLFMAEQINDREYQSQWNADFAAILLEQGRLAEAEEHVARALDIAQVIQNAPCTGRALVVLGELYIAQAHARIASEDGENEKEIPKLLLSAEESLLQALALKGLESETKTRGHLGLAQVSLLRGEREQARQQATQALEEARSYELVRLVERCEGLLGEMGK